MSVPLSDTRLAEPAHGVVFDHPDHDRVYAWGPFASLDMAARFAMFVRSEIDPAKVIPWPEATALPGVRVVDPVAELLTWSTTVAQRQTADACPADCPCRSTPLAARWDKEVVHPTPGDTECLDTLVCCVAATGQPVALWLDDEHREALGLALLLPDGDGDVDPRNLLVPAWEVVYEPGNVSDYLIGYANDEEPAKAAAASWFVAQRADEVGRLVWAKQPHGDAFTAWFDLIHVDPELGEVSTGITVRCRALGAGQ